jgi:hypothetical protein
MAKRFFPSLILGFATCELIGAIVYLPYSSARDFISDALRYPGGLIASPFFPEGVHTGGGAAYRGLAAYLGNLLFYAALWFWVIYVVRHSRARRKLRSSHEPNA